MSTSFELRHWASQPRLSLLPRVGKVALQGRKENVLPSQRLKLLSSSFLSEASRGWKASHPPVLTHVSNMSSGRSFRKVALEGRQKHSLRTRPAPSPMMLPASRKRSPCHVWLAAGVSAVGHHVLNASGGDSRSTYAFIYGDKTLPLPPLESLQPLICA